MSSQGGDGDGDGDGDRENHMNTCRAVSHASKKAGLQFSVHKVTVHLARGKYTKEVTRPATVYLAAVLQYIAAEVMELAGNAAQDENLNVIMAGHIRRAINKDEELKKLFGELYEPASMEYDVECLSGMLGALTTDNGNGKGNGGGFSAKHSSSSSEILRRLAKREAHIASGSRQI